MRQPMSDELKPCPFCGSESAPHVTDCIETMVCHNIAECDDETLFWVTCSVLRGGCGAEAGYVRTKSEAVAAWNARAAVTDDQLAVAVHDGRAWRVVRECEMLEVQTGDKTDYWDAEEIIWHCQSCHEERAVYAFGEDGGVWAEKPKFCPNCGAKVAPC